MLIRLSGRGKIGRISPEYHAMKITRLLISAFALCTLSTVVATPAQAQENALTSPNPVRVPIDEWIVDLLTNSLSEGGWDCQCTPRNGSHEVKGFFPADEIEPRDGHTYRIGNFSDSEIRVSLRLVEPYSGIELGKAELVVGPESARNIHLDFYIPEGQENRLVMTHASVAIPQDAGTTRDDAHMVMISRQHNSQRENVGDFTIDHVKCSKQRCLRAQDGGIGGCHGPSFHDCI